MRTQRIAKLGNYTKNQACRVTAIANSDLRDHMYKFIDDKDGTFSEYTLNVYRSYFRSLLKFLGENDLSPSTLGDYFKFLKLRVSCSTFRTVFSVFRSFLFAVSKCGGEAADVAKHLLMETATHHDTSGIKYMSGYDVSKLSAYSSICDCVLNIAKLDYEESYGVRELQRYLIIYLLRRKGLLVDDLLHATGRDIAADKLYIGGRGKRSSRVVDISEYVSMFRELARLRGSLPLFGSKRSYVLHHSAIHSIVSQFGEMCGFKLNPSIFRATYIYELVAAGYTAREIATEAGASLTAARAHIREYKKVYMPKA